MLLGDLIVGSFSESKGLALGTTGEKFHFLGFNVFFFFKECYALFSL